jgi:Ca2+-binding RTX toxin-like protein
LDPGSEHRYEPLLTFPVATSGFYYVRVTSYNGSNSTGAYDLWVAIDSSAATEKRTVFDYTLTSGAAHDTGAVTVVQTTGTTITGTAANETLLGANGQTNTLNGGDGNDVLMGGNSTDTLNGGNGIDTVSYAHATAGVTVSLALTTAQNTVGAGTDTITNVENLTGSNFNDILTGSTGDNLIFGGAGNDTINGGNGNDILWGQLGNDSLIGGAGADVFSFAHAGLADADVIQDFLHGTDKIGLDNAFFLALGLEGNLSASAFQVNASGNAANTASTFVTYDQSNGQLWYDADGSGTGAAVLIATVYSSGTTPATGLDANDFRVI